MNEITYYTLLAVMVSAAGSVFVLTLWRLL